MYLHGCFLVTWFFRTLVVSCGIFHVAKVNLYNLWLRGSFAPLLWFPVAVTEHLMEMKFTYYCRPKMILTFSSCKNM